MPETAHLPTFDDTVHASAHEVEETPQEDRVLGFLLLAALLTTTGAWIYLLARAFWAAAVWIVT
ncbi:hypothetical protein Q3C01_13635 [Bradyrhizobium sp. UFLA05-109]